MGGGTLDVTILGIEGGKFSVKTSKGDTHLGGQDIDEAIVKHFIEEFKNQEGVDVSK